MKARNIKVGKDFYKALVLKIEEKDAEGLPRKLTALYDDESTRIEGGEEFMIVYARADMTTKHPRN